jgi:hypothetical protein
MKSARNWEGEKMKGSRGSEVLIGAGGYSEILRGSEILQGERIMKGHERLDN